MRGGPYSLVTAGGLDCKLLTQSDGGPAGRIFPPLRYRIPRTPAPSAPSHFFRFLALERRFPSLQMMRVERAMWKMVMDEITKVYLFLSTTREMYINF